MKFFHFFLWFISSYSYSQNLIVDKIEFLGTKRMNKSFLEKMILTKKGAVLDSTQLGNDIQILNRLNGISKAEFKVIKLENNLVDVNYTITENFSLIPVASIWTTDEIGAYRIGLYEYNFLGKNNTIGGFYQYNGFHSYGINFASPQFFSSKFGIGTNIQKLISKEPIYFLNSKANYQYTNTSAEIISNYQINTKNEVKLGLTIFNEKYNYIDGTISSDIPRNLDINKQLIKMQYSFDNVNYDYYLVKGFRSNSYLQFVVSDKNFQDKFVIGWNDFLFYKRVGDKGNWASRLRLGLATNNISPFSPFSVDNNLNIRGVGNIIDRGTGAIVFNTEFRKTLYEKKWFVLQGNAFVDSGTWRNPGGNFSDFSNQKNIRIYPGLGIRFIHKTIFNAVFRLDYGYGITKNASKGFVFGIGQYF
jgi:outer membrane protein assembly factor BamA